MIQTPKPTNGVLGHLSRRTSSGAFIPLIDGLRFIAIGMVVLAHVANFSVASVPTHDRFLEVIQQGNFGVEIFFVISGFILALPFAAFRFGQAKRVSLRRYYLRRVTRLEPPYILSLLLIAVGLAIFADRAVGPMLPHLLAGLVYSHSVVYDEFNTVNWVAWSLEIEIQFYVLVPLLTLVFLIRNARFRRATILGCALLAIVLERYALHPISDRFGLTIFAFLQFFLMGFLLADFYLERWRGLPRERFAWDTVWIVGMLVLSTLLRNGTHSGFSPTATWIVPFLTLSLFVAAFHGKLARKFLTNPWIFTIGGMCYSIYLLHLAVIWSLHRALSPLRIGSSFAVNWLIQDLLVIPMILAVAVLFFVVVERPCMNPNWPTELRTRLRRPHAVVLDSTATEPTEEASNA